jgi:hypothetical protein
MQREPESERDVYDQAVRWALRVSVENAQPSEQVWQRIIHQLDKSVSAERTAPNNVREDRLMKRVINFNA